MTSLIYNTGTVTVTNGSATVAGDLTGWAVALVTGGLLSVGGVTVPILSVESDTSLTLAYGWPGSTDSGAEYAIARQPSEATARAATWTVDRLAKLAQTPWGVGVIPDGRGTLAERDAVTPLPNDDYCWLRVEVDEPAELYFRDGGVWLGPYALKGEQGDAGVGEGGYGLPAGGATGQVPRKASATDGDVGWETLDAVPRVPNVSSVLSDPDLNTLLDPGWSVRIELTTSSITNAPPTSGIFYLLVLYTNSTRTTQVLFPYSNPSQGIWHRTQTTSWSSWTRLLNSGDAATTTQGAKADSALQPAAIGVSVQAYDDLLAAIAALTTADGKFMAFTGSDTPVVRDIVGTVSQSSGVPTGAIIEKGSNSNGNYVKYADGTMICWTEINGGGNTSVAAGALFSHDEVDQTIWTFPAAFAANPGISASVKRNTWDARRLFMFINGSTPLTTTQVKLTVASTATASSLAVQYMVSAFGRWF